MRLLMLKSVLAAADLDDGASPVLRTATRLAELSGAELHLLHVEATPSSDGVSRLKAMLGRSVPGAPEPASIQSLWGSPAEVITQQAAELQAGAIVLGPHRRGPGGSEGMGEMGSTAARVVRTAPCPCLVAARELPLPLERVLVPVDVTDNAIGTLAVAISWASALRPRGQRATISALHVMKEGGDTEAAELVNAAVARARGSAGAAAQVDLRAAIQNGGDPARRILETAAADRPDLLVMGTRRPDVAAEELGSVSAAVARETPVPLLLVPPSVSAALARSD